MLVFMYSKISKKVAIGFAWQKAKAIRGGSSNHKHLLFVAPLGLPEGEKKKESK